MDVSDADIRALIDDKYDGSTENKSALRHDMNRLALGEPLAYVIGWIPFLGTRIYLDSKPLIPRPETEWWTEKLIQQHWQGDTLDVKVSPCQSIRVLDLCSGSGAIGCAILKQVPNVHVSFGELDAAHESTILKNIRENSLDENRTAIRIGDLFEPFGDEKFDIIAMNPPYIPSGRELDASVTNHEPANALFAGDDGLAIIRRIAAEAPFHLHPGGELWMECDISNIEEARKLVLEGPCSAGYPSGYPDAGASQGKGAKHADILTDPYGRPRVIVGHY